MSLPMICARVCASSNARRVKSQRYRPDKPTIARAVSATIAMRRRVRSDIVSARLEPTPAHLCRPRFALRRRPVLLELVEQRFQTNPENLRCPSLVVLGVPQGELDQRFFRLADRRSYRKTHG